MFLPVPVGEGPLLINLQDLNLADITKIEQFADPSYGLPDLSNPRNFIRKSISLDGEIIGSALAHLTSEVSLVLDPKVSALNKARVLKIVFDAMLREIREAGLEDTHVFVLPESDEHYKEFLMKHFNFVKASGIPLYLYPR